MEPGRMEGCNGCTGLGEVVNYAPKVATSVPES